MDKVGLLYGGKKITADKFEVLKGRVNVKFKRENIFFPYLERHNITGPPSVMWSVDDEIRDMAKSLAGLAGRLNPENTDELLHKIKEDFVKVKDKSVEMFFRDNEGQYMGTMEVTQDLTELRALQGERRLLQYSG